MFQTNDSPRVLAEEFAVLGRKKEYTDYQQPYLVQNDSSSCGPILVLAFFYEYTGTGLVGIEAGSVYEPWFRGLLLDWYLLNFRTLVSQNLLFTSVRRRGIEVRRCWPSLEITRRHALSQSVIVEKPKQEARKRKLCINKHVTICTEAIQCQKMVKKPNLISRSPFQNPFMKLPGVSPRSQQSESHRVAPPTPCLDTIRDSQFPLPNCCQDLLVLL